jgi:hypothetical protein
MKNYQLKGGGYFIFINIDDTNIPMQVNERTKIKEVYERIGIWLDLNSKVINLIVRYAPRAKKDRFISPHDLHIIKIMNLRR